MMTESAENAENAEKSSRSTPPKLTIFLVHKCPAKKITSLSPVGWLKSSAFSAFSAFG
jgi:hypothetical protein